MRRQRRSWKRELTGAERAEEVVQVIVLAMVDDILHPHRGDFMKPDVAHPVPVGADLYRVVELMRQGHTERRAPPVRRRRHE